MTSLVAHVFNVEHGDSIVLRITPDDSDEKWVLIDSNTVQRGGVRISPACELLKKEGVRSIDLVVVTHLHADHYAGIDMVFDSFEVRKLAIPPFISQNSLKIRKQVFQKYKEKILDTANRVGDAPQVNASLRSLAKLIRFILDNDDKVEEAAGPESILRIPGTESVHFRTYLPLRKTKGVLIQRILDDDFELDFFPEMNDASVVLGLEIAGTLLLWGADSVLAQWREHQRRMRRDGKACLGSSVVKVPHHGSKHNSQPWLYEYLLDPPTEGKHVLVSANGVTHPHREFFKIVSDLGLVPYCTNLHSECAESELFSIEKLTQIPQEMRPFLINYKAHRRAVPCQGDITVAADSSGIRLMNSTGVPCVYSRGVRQQQALFH